jgi:hypothetical protein
MLEVPLKSDKPRARLEIWKRAVGSFAALALVLPGGSLIAFSVLAFRHRKWLVARARRTVTAVLAFAAGIISPH